MVDERIAPPAQGGFAMAEVRPLIGAHEARVNITWAGQNGDLPDPVAFDATDGDVKQWVSEAVRGGIPGIRADPAINLQDFVVDRFNSTDARPYNLIQIRPKTPFGASGRGASGRGGRRLADYVRKYGVELGGKLYGHLQREAAYASAAARLKKRLTAGASPS